MNQNQTSVTDDQLDEELSALIGDATNAGTATVTSTATAANDESGNVSLNAGVEIDLEQIEALATAEEIRNTAYAEQEAEEAAPEGTAPSSTVSKTPRTPRASRAAGAKASSVLKSVIAEPELLKAACLVEGDVESEEALDNLKITIDGLAKKVGDKAVNLLRFRSQPKRLQTYTRLGLQLLVKNGGATSKELTDHLQANGYTIGTARSQANQLMALLPALKVADKSGRSLALNTASTIVAEFEAALAA